MRDDRPDDELRQALLELHFGCGENEAELRERIDRDPRVRALWDEVRATGTLLEAAAREPIGKLELPTASAIESRPWFTRRPLRIAAAAAAILAIALPFFGLLGYRELQRDDEASSQVRLLVSAPTSVPDGASIPFAIRTRDLDDDPVACAIEWTLVDGQGVELVRENRSSDGDDLWRTTASMATPRRLAVTARTADWSRRVELDLSPTRAAPLVHVATDRPIYRPGESARLRAVFLDRLSLLPSEPPSSVELTIVGPSGETIRSERFRSLDDRAGPHTGVLGYVWEVPSELPGGEYRFRVAARRGGPVLEEHTVEVRRYQPPRLAKRIELDRASYAPGDRGFAEVSAARLGDDGGRASGARVDATVLVDGRAVWDQRGMTLDGDGRAWFEFTLPDEIEHGAARFVARIVDGGTVETKVHPFVVPTGTLSARAWPEGGELVAGVPTRVYVAVRDSLDRPTTASGRVVDDRGEVVAAFKTEHQGRGIVELTPAADRRYRLELDDLNDSRVELPPIAARGLGLRVAADGSRDERAVLRIETRAVDVAGPLTVTAFCRGAIVGSAQVREPESTFELPLDASAFGVLRVTAFDGNLAPVAERLVHVARPSRELDVAISTAHDETVPGQRQRVTVAVTDDTGAPRAGAIVGLTVVDSAVESLAGETRLGLVDVASLFTDVGPDIDERGSFLRREVGEATASRRIDLLLGTLDQPRFAWADDGTVADDVATLAAKHGRDTKSIRAADGEFDRTRLRELQRSKRSAARLASIVTAIGVFLFLLVLGAELGIWLARRLRWSRGTGGDFTAGLTSVAAIGAAIAFALFPALESAAPSADAMAAGDILLRSIEAEIAPEEIEELTRESAFDWSTFDDTVVAARLRASWFAPPENEADADEEPVLADTEFFADDSEGDVALRRFEPSSPGGFYRGPSDAVPPGFVDARAAAAAPPFAFAYSPGDGARRDFTETLLWSPLLITDATGTASVEFDVSDRLTTWSIHADAHGDGRIGQQSGAFRSGLPFHLEAKLPVEVTAGDRLDLPVAIHDRTGASIATVEIAAPTGFALANPGRHEVSLRSGRGRHFATVTVGETPRAIADAAELRLVGSTGNFRDRVTQSIRVVPRGFPHVRSWAGTVSTEEPAELVIPIPASVLAGSTRVAVRLYPSPLAGLREGLQGIVREPHGCFEQASSANYPNVLILSYLEATGDSLPAVALDARRHLPRGYELISSYECTRRGFEWFGNDPGHGPLTAYGLFEFVDMGRVFDVESAMVDRTRDWLLGRRDGSGGFTLAPDSHAFGRAPATVIDAYLTWSLLYSGSTPDTLRAEIDRLTERATASNDAYELALVASGLAAAGRSVDAERARVRLTSMQQGDGRLVGSTSSITSSGGTDLAVETTGFAVLAWLAEPSARDTHATAVRRAVDFLRQQRDARGRFGATQATIVALKALTAWARAERERGPRGDGTAVVFVGDDEIAREAFTSDQPHAVSFDLGNHLAVGREHTVRIVVSSPQPLAVPWACDLEYHADRPADDPDSAVRIETSLDASTVDEGRTVALRASISNRRAEPQPMALAVVGIPAGLAVERVVLDDLREAGAFDFWELDGRELALYWTGLAAEERKDVVLDLTARIPGTTTGPASRAYLYYSPDARRWAEPLRVTVRAVD